VLASNLSARAGRWSASHWKRATIGWLLFVLGAVALGSIVGIRSLSQADMASGETSTAEHILASAGFQRPATESVLIQSSTRTADQCVPVIGEVVRVISQQKDVANIQTPFLSPARLVSRDGHSALVQFDITGDRDKAKDKVQPILDAVAGVQRAHPAMRIEQFGPASAYHMQAKTLTEDFGRAERLSLPVTLVILFLAFGALVAAGLPVVLAFSAVLAAIGITDLVSQLLPAADATKSVILLVGMAVGVDYSLFYLRRVREERAAGLEPHQALLRTAATSGQAVLISGATVLIAMAGMFFAGNGIFTSIALGTMVVVFVALVGSLSVLPALLHKLGDRIEKGSLPFIRRARRPAGESRFWSAVLRPALRHPAAAALISAGVLAAAAVPVLSMHTKLPSFTDLPHSLAFVRNYQDIQQAFPGSQTPAEVVVKAANVSTPAFQRAYADGRRRALATGQLYEPFHVFVSPNKTVARIEFAIAGNGDNSASMRALQTLRRDVIAPIAKTLPGATVAVTGQTAGTHDFNETMKQRAPLVFAFVLGLAFLLLLFTFRSIVIPVTTILLNLLSVGAAYGILILVFQQGHLQGLLGFHSNGAIAAWLPLFLFVILFGLSMDYHVFILSRIKELVDRGTPTSQAVEQGILHTAGTVTSAAIVMVSVFAIFGALRELDIKQMGFGLGIAVLLDATVVRAVLLPSTMKLLGERNWYLPRQLAWLPTLRFGDTERKREPKREQPQTLKPVLEARDGLHAPATRPQPERQTIGSR
jgi:uncharacterized membrane protein YdfJ with MMPL/SSD domain